VKSTKPLLPSLFAVNVFVYLIIFALIVRLFFYFSIFILQPQKFAIRDLDGYANIANNLIGSGIYSRDPTPPLTLDLTRPPVYPILLAGLMLLGNFNGNLIVLFQILISSATVGVTWLLGIELHQGKPSLLVAGLLVALDPILILLGHYLLSETIFLFELIFALWLFVKYLNNRQILLLIASAVVLAFSALTRPIVEFFPLILLFILLWIPTLKNWRVKIRDAILFLSVFLVLLVPWMIRNLNAGGVATLSTIPDINLFSYRAKAVLADAANISQEDAAKKLNEELAAFQMSGELTPSQAQSFMRSRAIQIMSQYPLQTLKMTGRGAVLLLFDPGYSLVCAVLDPNNFTPECFQGNATMLGSNLFSLMESRFLTMTFLQKITLVWSSLLMGLLYVGAATGTILLIRKKQWLPLMLLLGSIAYFVALSSGAESLYRLRVPILPLLAILTGVSFEYFSVRTKAIRNS
jgi:4-amino-4-deoxy-L-arabinose transferase-like glycosyltransferase